MTVIRPTSGCLLLIAAAGGVAAKDVPATLTIGPDMAVAGTIAGRSARLQMLPNGSSTLVMNPDAATRLGMRPGWFGVRVKIGPVVVAGRTAVIRYGVAGTDERRRVAWFDRPIAPGFDGTIGPTAVPQPVVIFRLRPPVVGEHPTVLPLVDRGYDGAGTMVAVGGQTIFVEWAPTKPHDGATAAAAATIASAYGGRFSAPSWDEPMAFGVKRPVRQVILERPLVIGPLRIGSLVTRIRDGGDTGSIPDADADPAEIVVTARGKRSKPIHSIEIGTDTMRSCSSILFDKPHRQIVLNCR